MRAEPLHEEAALSELHLPAGCEDRAVVGQFAVPGISKRRLLVTLVDFGLSSAPRTPEHEHCAGDNCDRDSHERHHDHILLPRLAVLSG
jgi:hypothetical protein